MGVPAMHPVENDGVTSEEARERINSARVRDLSFLIRRVSNRSLDQDDVLVLARALASMEAQGRAVTNEALTATLRANGLSAHKTAQLAAVVFGKT